MLDVSKNWEWDFWVKFFLRGVAVVADEATTSAKAILKIKDEVSKKLYSMDNGNSNYQRLLDYLFEQPFIKRSDEEKMLGVSNPTAGNIIETFCQMGILQDCTPQKSRNKLYAFAEYLDILERGTEVV